MAVLVFLGDVALVSSAEPLLFNRDVRPILASACLGCHGQGKQKGNLRLDLPESAYAKNKKSERAAFVPRKPADSEAIRRILSSDQSELMPPPDSKKTLTAEQKATLKRWVEEGAVYEPHWSFTPIALPAVPKAGDGKPAANPIDAFLEARLAAMKLKPNAEADRPTLIRRVAFALTGLPPTQKEIDTYLADVAEGAYERMVDRYLGSSHHGEEMARHWLDVARYADTHGLHLDNERGIWPYRDWVVRSFNENRKFDRFTIEQLAGDLLPNATTDQLVATGFNRCNVTTGEGGSIDAEWYYRNAVDRAAVAGETWLGLTVGCAQCHDHKYDPISQKEFYSLYAYFYSAAGSPLDGNALYHEPSVRFSTPEQAKQLADMSQKILKLDADIAAITTKYVDPGAVAAATGIAANPAASDLSLSFSAWVHTRGGPGANKFPKEISAIFSSLKQPAQQPNSNQIKQLRDYYLRAVCTTTSKSLDPLMKAKETLAAEKIKLEKSQTASMIFRDEPTPRQAFVMVRGQYNKPGEKVEPATPDAFPKLQTKGRQTRLDLANWLVSKENPLTARVYVNRLWQQFFGVGLVKTSSDFGLQGDPPTHPELLDWLAANFRDGGWDVRATVRLMVTSAAFRRSSRVTPAVLEADPENRLYARGPRFRLDAEQVRDNVLFLSGLLDPTIGGKGVKPYQPDNIWEPVAFTGSNTQHYKRDSGNALYRRTMYTFYKRTAPPTFMVNFDSPNREQPCSRRDRSNTPLQALQLLNDVQHVEAARVFAERMLLEGGQTNQERLKTMFRAVLSRMPTAAESTILQRELDSHLARYAKAPDDAKKLIALGESKPNAKLKPEEVAAFTLTASTILNLDETLTRN